MGHRVGEASPAALETMKATKRTLDPRNIMIPGKVVAV
jgi:FAD/FMN-containing dehydrogenase